MVSTFAFTVCFMVWMMFAVIGIPIKKTLESQCHPIWPADGHAGA
jgi:nitrate/nitrite transporter NarK